MSCPTELTYAVYLDGELPPEQVRPVEAHLVQCRRCRELVVALREEAELDRVFRASKVDHLVVRTDRPYVDILVRFFRDREKRI